VDSQAIQLIAQKYPVRYEWPCLLRVFDLHVGNLSPQICLLRRDIRITFFFVAKSEFDVFSSQ